MTQRMIFGLMAGVALWGAVLAFGAYRWQGGNVWRGAIVALCVAGFLQFWLVALIVRARRVPRPRVAPPAPTASEPPRADRVNPPGESNAATATPTGENRGPDGSDFPRAEG